MAVTASEVPPSATPRLDVLVIGAGLAGLSAAISIASGGHRVRVLEAASQLIEVGAGLQVTPNASRILRSFALPQSFWDQGAEPTALTVYSYRGRVLAKEESFDANIRAKYGAKFIDFHRADVHTALYHRARDVGVEVLLGQRVESLDTNRVTVTTRDGHAYTADVLVAADGLWSRCRQLFQTVPDDPRPTGDLAYRIVLTLDQVQDPELRQLMLNPEVRFWIGPHAHAVAYSVRGGQMYNIVLLVPDDLPPGVPRNAGSIKEMRAFFKDWDPLLTRFLDCVDQVEKWKLLYQPELPRWISETSNVVFIGDSCHPMLPYLAQGANSSIEDGATLGSLLAHVRSGTQVHEALEIFEDLRKTRCDRIVQETFKQRHDFHLPDGEEQEMRDRLFLSQIGKTIQGPFPSRWTCPEVQPWLYGYDSEKEVLLRLQEGGLSRPSA